MKTTHRCMSVLVALAAFGAGAQQDTEPGKAKSLACQACHGSQGIGSAPDIPNLAGQKGGYLATQLKAFRQGTRKHDLMNAVAAQLSDADIAQLAGYWASLPAAPATVADTAGDLRKSKMAFPADFPANYVRYREIVNEDKSVTQSFANRIAIAAAKEGKPLPPGSAIFVVTSSANQVTSYSAMESRAGWGESVPDVIRNGDWSYALFDAGKQLRANVNYARCLACHKPKAPDSYVFTMAELKAAAAR